MSAYEPVLNEFGASSNQETPVHRAYNYANREIYQLYIAPNTGISLLIAAQFFNSIMVITCKLLVTDDSEEIAINPFQILFVRMFITYICCLIYMVLTKSVPNAPFGPIESRKLLIMRGFFGFFGVCGLYYSLQYLSVSDAVAITFLVPMITGLLAWIVLGERYSLIEGLCAIISFGGVLLIAKPSFIFGSYIDLDNSVDDSIESSSTKLRLLASGVGLIGVLGASSVYIIIRKMGKAVHPLLSVSYFSLITCIISSIVILLVPSYKFILPNSNYQWFLFLLIGFSGFIMQCFLTMGIQQVRAGKASLMSYSNMVFAIFWEIVIWNHFPGFLSLSGIIIIITCAVAVLKFKTSDDQVSSNADLENNELKYNNITLDEFLITDDETENEQQEGIEVENGKSRVST